MPIFLVDVNRSSVFGSPLRTIDDATMSRYHAAIYDGCEFGCAYCEGWGMLARPLNESVRMMPHIAQQAAAEVSVMHRDDVIGLIADSDAYQPAEQQYRRTRSVLTVLADRPHPVVIMTKSPFVLDDIELLQQIHAARFAMVIVSIVSHNPEIQHKFEDKVASFAKRLALVTALKQAGIPVGVALMPLVPYINDTDYALTQVIQQVAAAGADFLYWDFLRMPNLRHRNRMNDVMVRVGNYPISYLRELYPDGETIDKRYQGERNAAVLRICDDHRVPVRLPYPLFRGRFGPSYTVAQIIAQQSSRDVLQGRDVLARQGNQLAESVRAGEWPVELLKSHPTYALFRELIPTSAAGSAVL